MSSNPLVTILMPVYNAEKFLDAAIRSILSQTFTDFEFLIINDGSTDSSKQVISDFHDKRIRYVENPSNKGLSYTLNRGLHESQGKYIARMDADDLSLSNRLDAQVKFMESHPEYGVVGVLFAVRYLPQNKLEIGGVRLLEDLDLKLALRESNVFCHGEVMMRKSLIQNHKLEYDPSYTPCEDYDLWRKLAVVTKFQTLPQISYIYTVHPLGMSGTQSEKMTAQIKRISQEVKHSSVLPKPSLKYFLHLWRNGRSYSDEPVTVEGEKFHLYMKLNYQVFLFRLGPVFWPVSFLISPLNWFKKLFGLFPKPPKTNP